MAIVRSAGTEIIWSVCLEAIDSNVDTLIVGVQHHIYTVLSITVQAQALNADRDYVRCYLVGYDSNAGTTAQDIVIFRQDLSVEQTFVWGDKFSFNGYEPVDFTGPMDNATKQDAIADQGSSVAQKLHIHAEHGSDNLDVTCTFIDQNNA